MQLRKPSHWQIVKGGSADQSKFEIPSDRVWGFRFAGNQGFFSRMRMFWLLTRIF